MAVDTTDIRDRFRDRDGEPLPALTIALLILAPIAPWVLPVAGMGMIVYGASLLHPAAGWLVAGGAVLLLDVMAKHTSVDD